MKGAALAVQSAVLDHASRSHGERAAGLLHDEKRGEAGGRLHS
jgi:hypothetical protein